MANNLILLMDDDENICKVIRLYLEKEGMTVEVAHDGATGLELFQKETPNLVLLDIMMPGMDGIEVIKQIRKDSTVPVIMLTAKGDTIDKVLALELGADDYIVKPFEPKELIARIKAVIRRAENISEEEQTTLKYPNLEISIAEYTVEYRNSNCHLRNLSCSTSWLHIQTRYLHVNSFCRKYGNSISTEIPGPSTCM